MPTTVRQLTDLVRGQLEGDGEQIIDAARPVRDAGPGDITFVESERYTGLLQSSKATAAVVPLNYPTHGRIVIRVADPILAFATIVRHLHGRPISPRGGVSPQAFVHPTAQLGAEVTIEAFASVGEGAVLGDRCQIASGARVGAYCRLGNDVVLFPNVVLYDETRLGDRVVIHANAVLGADGFGYRFQGGRQVKVPQLGWVEIEDDVEIGAGTTIDRGTFGATSVGMGTKIDNLVQIGHNCRIGRHNLLVSQVGIAGSTTTGDYVVAAGQAGICDHVTIGDRVVIGAKSGVVGDVMAGQRVLGAPATPEREQKRVLLTLNKLPEMHRELRKIKQHLGMKDGEE